jgi:hypothetical protein
MEWMLALNDLSCQRYHPSHKDRKKEIGPGLLKAMLDQLGLTKKDLESE